MAFGLFVTQLQWSSSQSATHLSVLKISIVDSYINFQSCAPFTFIYHDTFCRKVVNEVQYAHLLGSSAVQEVMPFICNMPCCHIAFFPKSFILHTSESNRKRFRQISMRSKDFSLEYASHCLNDKQCQHFQQCLSSTM